MDRSLIELWASMGLFAHGVVIVLLVMSLCAATIAIQKGFQFRRSRRATIAFSRPFARALAQNDLALAQRVAEAHPDSHLAASLGDVVPSLRGGLIEAGGVDREMAVVERMVELNGLEQLARLRRGVGVLATTGATAPFVGLLGTVVGVVHAFTGMAVSGSGGLTAISRGIAEALVTTALGLIVAIPSVWLYNYFVNRIELLSMEISYGSRQLIDFLLRGRQPRAAAG